jgi:purine-cytosine permease-like protein
MTSEHNKAAAPATKRFIPLLISTVCLGVLLDELRSLVDYQTWLDLLLACIVASVVVAVARTLSRRRQSQPRWRR